MYSDEDVYPCTGRGLCIIITNFIGVSKNTAHLPGYVKDKRYLLGLFETMLGFDVIVETKARQLENLSLTEFQEALKELQNEVKERFEKAGQTNKYDRFFMFVLSHGGVYGICTCKSGSFGREKEYNDDGNVVFISVEEIINAFTHDNVPQLKGIPKAFFFQACRGSTYITPAADKDDETNKDDIVDVLAAAENEEADKLEDYSVKVELKKPTLKRENIFIAYATLEHKYCFVDKDEGSWFIETIVKQIQHRCHTEHIFEIMTRVIQNISGKIDKMFFHCNNPRYEIRVWYKGAYRPLLINGKLPKANDPKFHDFQPLHVANISYVCFAPSMGTNQELINYEFKGNIEYRKVKGASTLPIESWISAEELKTFQDRRNFKITGEMRQKEMHNTIVKGEFEIIGHTFNIHDYIRPQDRDKMADIVIQGYLPGIEVWLTEEDMLNMEAQVFIENHLHSIGKLEKCTGSTVFGVYAEIYQLPSIYSTLTKKMYVTAPKQTATKVSNHFVIA